MHRIPVVQSFVSFCLAAMLLFSACSGSNDNPLSSGEKLSVMATASPSPSPTPSVSPTPVPSSNFFLISEAEIESESDSGYQSFEIEGVVALSEIDSIDVTDTDLVLTFGDFTQTIPTSSFERHDAGFRFEGSAPGIERIDIEDSGWFEIKAEGVDLSSIALPGTVSFSVQVAGLSASVDIQFDSEGKYENPVPLPSPSPSPTVSPSPSPSPTVSPSPSPSPTVSPSPSPSPTVSPSPSPSPTVSPSPSPSPTVSPSPSPSPTVSPSPSPSPTVSPSPSPSPTVSPSPSPSPTVSPSPSPSPEVHVDGAIQALVVSGPQDGEVTVQGIRFIVSSATTLEDDDGSIITLHALEFGETVDAWGPLPQNGTTQAKRIREN